MAAITSAAQAAIAAAAPGESKENTLYNKIRSLADLTHSSGDGPFWHAIQTVIGFYTQHPHTSGLTEAQVSDKWFWLPLDLFEWRWGKEKLLSLFPWWEFTHNTGSHYTIVPDEYVCPAERWKTCETTLRQPTYHTMYNVPDIESSEITYWDVFGLDYAHPEVRDYISSRGCPTDLDDFVYCWAADDRTIARNPHKWARRGITQHIVTCTEKVSGITMKQLMDAAPAKLVRQATWNGKFYWNSNACPPRERVEQNGDDLPIVVHVTAPSWLHNCPLHESGTIINRTWKITGVPAGKKWMIDVIWANLTPPERKVIQKIHKTWLDWGGDYDSYIEYWLCIQLEHNWGDCFTAESKDKVKNLYINEASKRICAVFKEKHLWMLTPRTAKW